MKMLSNLIIDTKEFNNVIGLLRQFFLKKGFVETHTQNRLSILAACEDPDTVSTFQYMGDVWPLPQTGQMWLEYELLKNPNLEKIFCITTSYRNEPSPIKGRHDLIFPMFEFEMKGDMEDLINFELELLQYLGYQTSHRETYEQICEGYKTKTLEHKHEQRLYNDYGPVVFITNFPMHTSPFWNMKITKNNENMLHMANKVDVILSGIETIGSAERSTDRDIMMKTFGEISDGKYAERLYSLFGKNRVDREMEDYLNNTFIQRCGGGIGITRLIKSLKKENLL